MSSAGVVRAAVAAMALTVLAVVGRAWAQPDDGIVVLPARLDAEGLSQMLIPIRAAGHTFWCSADSGGSRVLSLDLTKALNAGLQPNATGTSAGVGPDVRRDQRVRGVNVEIGSVVLRDATIVLVPRPPVVPDIDCVLGLGLLPEYAIEFDYLKPSVRLIPSARFRPAAAAVAIPLAIDRVAMPLAKTGLRLGNSESVDATLIVDTGASYYDVVLLKPFIDANRVTDRVGTVVPRFSDSAGMTIAAARTTAITVGPFEIAGPVTALIATSSGGTLAADGLLGTGFLRRFTVTFDYSRQQLWLEPNGRTREPQPFDASGIEVRPAEAGFAIVAVGADSPAAEAGLRTGDLLAAIDGRLVKEMTLGEIQEAFNRAGETRTLTIDRTGRVETVPLKLRRRL